MSKPKVLGPRWDHEEQYYVSKQVYDAKYLEELTIEDNHE